MTAKSQNKAKTSKTQKKSSSHNHPSYKGDQFLVIIDAEKQDYFYLAYVNKNTTIRQPNLELITFVRDLNSQEFFKADELLIKKKTEIDILEVTEYPDIENEEANDPWYENTRVFLSKRHYRDIRARVKVYAQESGIIMISVASESESEPEPKRRRQFRKQSRSKKNQIKFRKGKENPFVHLVEENEQFEGNEDHFFNNCCVTCSSKDLLRAIKINNLPLFKKILFSEKEINGYYQKQGPHTLYNAFTLTRELKREKMLKILNDNQLKKLNVIQKVGLTSQYNTGFNDKYAYGVKLREVTQGRNNQEGNNAFLYNEKDHSRLLDKHVNKEFAKKNAQELTYKFTTLALLGKNQACAEIVKYCDNCGGWGLNAYFIPALIGDNLEEVEKMRKSNVNKKSGFAGRVSPIHLVTLNPNRQMIERFFTASQEFYFDDDFMRKPVHYAACSAYTTGLEYLLDNSVDLRVLDRNKMNPLMYACKSSRTVNVQFMCSKTEFNFKIKSKEGKAAVHYAVETGNVELVRTLHLLGADINLPATRSLSCLMIACQKGNYEMVRYLLESGAKQLKRDTFGKSALHYACINGHVKIASYLLKLGADFQKGDKSGNNGLHYAVAYGFYDFLDVFRESGLDINAVNNMRQNPLMIALEMQHKRIFEILLHSKGVELSGRNQQGKTILMMLYGKITQENLDYIREIFNMGNIEIQAQDFVGNNMFHLLAQQKIEDLVTSYQEDTKQQLEVKREIYSELFQLLDQNGCNMNSCNVEGKSPFALALQLNNKIFLQLALQSVNLDLTQINQDGLSVLFFIENLFYSEKGVQNIQIIFDKIKPKLKEFFNGFCKVTGYNFFHYLLEGVMKNNFNLTGINQQIQEESEKYRRLLTDNKYQLQQTPSNKSLNVNIKKFEQLLAKVTNADYITQKSGEIYLRNQNTFFFFCNLLFQHKYDFGLKVQKIEIKPSQKEPVEKGFDYNQYHQQQQQDFSSYQKQIDSNQTLRRHKTIINNWAGNSALHIVFQYEDNSIQSFLLNLMKKQRSYRKNELNYYKESLAYLVSKQHKCETLLNLLVKNKEKLYLENSNQNYAIFNIIDSQNFNLFCQFLNYTKDKTFLNVKNNKGETPLMVLVKRRNLKFILKLLEHKPDVHCLDNKGRNCLMWAISENKTQDKNLELEHLLIEQGINLIHQDHGGRNILHYFFISIEKLEESNEYDPIDIFFEFMDDYQSQLQYNRRDNLGNNPISYAAQRGAFLCALRLIDQCEQSINNINNERNSPLSISLLKNHNNFATSILTSKVFYNNPTIHQNYFQYQQEIRDAYNYAVQLRSQRNSMNWEEVRQSEYDRNMKKTNKKPQYDQYWQHGGFATQQNQESEESVPTHRQIKEYSEKQLFEIIKKYEEIRKKNNFLKESNSLFILAIKRNNTKIQFLLSNAGYNIEKAAMECLENRKLLNCIKLLSKKKLTFAYLNPENQNLFNIFAEVCNDFEAFEKIYKILLQKNIFNDVVDQNGNNPLLRSLLVNKNQQFAELLLESRVNISQFNNKNQNLLATFLINNTKLQRSKFEKEVGPNGSEMMLKGQSFNNQNTINIDHKGKTMMKSTFNAHNIEQESDDADKYSQVEVLNQVPQAYKTISDIQFFKKLVSLYLDGGLNLNDIFEYFKTNLDGIEQVYQHTLLSFATLELKNIEIAEILIENGADINQKNFNNREQTLLNIAIEKNDQPLFDFLKRFEDKIDFFSVDSDGRTYLHYCVAPLEFASFENIHFLNYILDQKIDIERQDNFGRNALYYAFQQKSKNMYNSLKNLFRNHQSLSLQKKRDIFKSMDFIKFNFDPEKDFETYTQRVLRTAEFKDFKHLKEPTLDYRFRGNFEMVKDEQEVPYMVTLTKVDIKYGEYSYNLYYRMQIGFDRVRNIYMLFTNWGRTAHEGQNQLTPFFTKEEVVKEFHMIFKQKTKNEYVERKNFTKYNKKYRYLKPRAQYEIQDLMNINVFDIHRIKRSDLPEWCQNLMGNLLDEKFYQIVYDSLQVNSKVLPLGSLNQEQIIQAKLLLEQIEEKLNEQEKNEQQLTNTELYMAGSEIFQLTNDYYELIPNSDNIYTSMPVIDKYMLKKELRKVYSLINLSTISQVMIGAKNHVYKLNPLDYCYRGLKIKTMNIDRKDELFQLIQLYLQRGDTDNSGLQISNLFAVERQGEAARFKKYEDKSNRRMLWHGTHTENIFSILKDGLRIAPLQVQFNGNQFNRGCYFSDNFSKAISYSSNYYNTIDKPIYILLCEVYLGKMKKLYTTVQEKMELGKVFQSVKGCGLRAPDKKKSIFLNNGCMLPIGELRNKAPNQAPYYGYNHRSKQAKFGRKMGSISIRKNAKVAKKKKEKKPKVYQFDKNEYVVYNKDQIRLRYVVELKNIVR